MTLYIVLRQDIGLKSEILEAFVILGIRTSVVAFHCLSKDPDLKNSVIAAVTSGPTTSQQLIKNSAEYPSGPLVLFRGKERKASLISSTENYLCSASVWSRVRRKVITS